MFRSRQFSRREAVTILGGAAAAAVARNASAAPPVFQKGAIIRTVLKDYPPEEFTGGGTLFHEHMSYPSDFRPRCNAFARATREANGEAPAGGGGRGGAPQPPPATP